MLIDNNPLLPMCHIGSWKVLHARRRVWTQEEKAGLTCPPDSAPAPAEVLAGVCWRGEEEEEGKERRRVSGADRQQTWQQHFLRWAILYSLSYLLTPSKCSVGKLGARYRWIYGTSEKCKFVACMKIRLCLEQYLRWAILLSLSYTLKVQRQEISSHVVSGKFSSTRC